MSGHSVHTSVINTTKTRPIPSRRISKLAKLIFAGERRSGRINVIMIGDARMRSLNSQFRSVDRTTDVLSFSLDDDEPDQPPSLTGEIYISVPQANRQARSSGHELSDEILFLASHGMLHLLGYTHSTTRDYNRMIDRQIHYLNKLYRKS